MAERTIIAGRGMPGKEDELYTLYSDDTILLREVRLSYPHVGRPYQGKKPNEDGKLPPPKFGAKLMLDKEKHAKSKRLIEREITKLLEKVNDGNDIKEDHKFLKDGDREGKAEMKGNWIVNTSETVDRPPALRTRKGEKVYRDKRPDGKKDGVVLSEREIDAMFFGGAWANVLIKPWWQPGHGKKVNASIRALQFVKSDESFGEGGIDDDEIDKTFTSLDDGDAGFDDDGDDEL